MACCGNADPALEDHILALDPEHVSLNGRARCIGVRTPPQIMNFHGGIYPVHLAMQDFAGFLVEMGYPAERIREPATQSFSYSPYQSSDKLAGKVAWFYEQQATRVMLIGHSQGGMQVVKCCTSSTVSSTRASRCSIRSGTRCGSAPGSSIR